MSQWTIALNGKIIKTFSIKDGDKKIIGRGKDADVIIDNTAVSRHHTAFEYIVDAYFIEDLHSLNGTFVNGNKIDSRIRIQEKDVIQIGKFQLMPNSAEDRPVTTSQSSSMDMDEETIFVTQKQVSPAPKESAAQTASHHLTVISGPKNGTVIGLDGRNSIKIGKDSSCDLVTTGWFIAKAQCYIINRDKKHFIVPQSSWIGTRVNGLKIKDEKPLIQGDIIEIKNHQIRFE